MKLNKAFKREWVKALRSGKYKQTTGFLYDADDDGYCCLGVARKIMGLRKKRGDEFISIPSARRLGLSEDMQEFLAMRNDGGMSFAGIADYIEEYY